MPTAESKQPIECRRCGVCCTWHQAFLTPADIERILKHLGITLEEWDELYDDPRWKYSEWRLIRHIDGACAFLKWEGGLSTCSIHSVKPECCAKWEAGLDKKECREKMGGEEVRGQNMAAKTIKQSVAFKAAPHDVYEALMDPKKHAAFTGGKASISRKVGGKFSVFDGYAEGVNVELEPDKKIVQTWRADDWPEGHYSKVTFTFTKAAGGTKLTFTQTGVPEDQYEDVAQGWKDYYWTPMKKMLEK